MQSNKQFKSFALLTRTVDVAASRRLDGRLTARSTDADGVMYGVAEITV